MSTLRNLWYRLEAVVVVGAFAVLSRIPIGLALGLGNAFAWCFFVLVFTRRRIAVDNILRAGICTDRREARRIALASFRTVVVVVVESILARRHLNEHNQDQHVRIELAPEIDALLREPGRGLIVATAHVGNWEVVARAGSRIKPLSALYKPISNPYLERILHAKRSGENLHLITKYDEDPLRLMRVLRDGEVLAIMMDQHARNGLIVDFFGQPAKTTPSVAMLHLVTRAPLLVAWAIRTGPLRYEVHVEGPIQFARTGDRQRDVLDLTQRLTDHIEQIARRWPEQYMWGHRRWKVSVAADGTE